MGKLFAELVILAAAAAAPAWAVAPDAPANGSQAAIPQAAGQQVYLRETQQVTGRAEVLYRLDNGPAVEGKAELVEYSQGLVVYEPAVARTKGQSATAELQPRPVSPVHTTTTSRLSWTPATLPTARSF